MLAGFWMKYKVILYEVDSIFIMGTEIICYKIQKQKMARLKEGRDSSQLLYGKEKPENTFCIFEEP